MPTDDNSRISSPRRAIPGRSSAAAAVAELDDDPILNAIRGSGTAAGAAQPEEKDPILAAINGGGSGASDLKVVPFSGQTAINTPTQAAAKVGKPMVRLAPPAFDATQVSRNLFTGAAQEPGMSTQEEIARSGTMSPTPDVTLPGPHGTQIHLKQSDIDAMGKVFLPGRNPNATLQGNEPPIDPSRGLIAPQNLMTEAEQQKHPVLTGLGELGEGLTTPENLAILAGTLGVGSLAGAGAKTLHELISAGFTAQMIVGAGEQVPGIVDAIKRGDTYNAKRMLTHAVGGAVMAGAASRGMLPEETPSGVPKGTISEPLARDAAAAERSVPEGTIGPKQEPLAPESAATLKAQTDALAKGTNKTVYFPKGTENIPAPPENAKVTIVPGEQAGAGTWYHTEDVKPLLILKSVKNGTFGQLLGNHQTKAEALASQSPTAIVARDAAGTEIKASLVDGSRPEVVTAQAATLQRQFPNAKISLEKPEDVIHERLGTTPTETENARPGSVSRETPTLGEQSASANDAPADLQPIIRHHSMDFFVLSRRFRRFDPGLADGLSEMSDGKLHTPADLQNFVDENIHDSKAKAELSKLVADYAAQSRGEATSKKAVNQADSDPILAAIRGSGANAAATRSNFSPEVLEEARHEIRAASGLASSFERPGRYFAAVGQTDEPVLTKYQSSEKGIFAGGTWYGVSSSRHMVAQQYPWFAKMKGGAGKLSDLVGKEKGAEYERLVSTVADHIQREKETAAPVIAEFAPRLRRLSEEIDGDDVELSETLAQVADGDGRGFKNLRQYLQEKVANAEQTRDFFKSVDAAAAEARQAGAEESTDQAGELRSPESGRSEKSSEAATGQGAPQDSRFFAPGKLSQRASAERQRALPGFESAIEEQRASAEGVRGEKLTEEANQPLGDISNAAGEMERRSPLFRGTAASPQRELLDALDEIGGGAEFTGTKYSGLSPAALKKLLPESVREKLDTEVEANQRARGLQGQLYDLESKNAADLIRARRVLKEAPGSPADLEAVYHHLEDSAVKLTSTQKNILDDFIRPLIEKNERINEKLDGSQVENYVHRIPVGKGNLLDKILGGESELSAGRGLSKSSASLKSRTMMALEDAQGNRKVVSIKNGEVTAWERGKSSEMGEIRRPVNPGVNEYFDKNVMDKLEKLADDLGISHERSAKRTAGLGGRRMGVSLTGQNAIKTLAGTPEQVILHEIGHQLDERYNLQKDFVNNAQTKVELRKLSDLRYEGLEASQNFKKYVRKGEEKMAVMFEAFLRAPERFKQVAPNTYGKFVDFLKSHEETRPILDIKPSLTIEKRNIGAEKNIPGTFLDKNGKRWNVAQATTKEIEAHTGVRYYKNALVSTVLNYLSLRKAERAHDFLESYKQSPEFQEVAAEIKGHSVPAGWRPTELPQFHGYAFEPHTAEVLDWYAKRMRAEGPNVYRQIGNFLRTAIFFNPLIHTPNIGVHWIVEKGLTGVGPQNWGRILRTGSRAIDAVIHQNNDFLSALDEGAPLQSARLDSGATTKLLLERMGRELEGNPTAAQQVAKALGYVNPAKLVRAVYNFSSKVTWVSNDVAMLQATYEHMERTGSSFKEAITDVSKHIPDYRLPTRIFNSTALAKLMSSPDLTMFGAYHYGALRSYGEMAKGLLSEDMPQAERMKSLDRLAMLGLFTFVAYPALDQLAKYLTGDKTAQFRRAGASTFIYNLAQLAKGEKSPTQVLESVVTPAVHTKALLQLAANRDFFTGRNIVDWNADSKTIGKQLARYGGQNLAPVNTGMQVTEGRRTLGQQVAGLAGIKTNVPTPAEALARKFAAESAGTAAPDQDTLERSYLRKQYENDLRDRKITPRDLARVLVAGKITDQDAKTILQRAAFTPLQNEFKSLPIEKALRVWEKADGRERQTLKALLVAKVERLNLDRYNPADLNDLIGRLRKALTGSLPMGPPNSTTGRIPRGAPIGTAGKRTGAPMTAPIPGALAAAN